MSTSFTIWHYLSFIIIAAMLSMAILYILRQKDIPQKGSFIATFSIVALILLISSIMIINTFTKQVIMVNVQNHRFLSTESIVYTGTVRNAGHYDVGQVEIEIEIFDKGLNQERRSSYQSTAFKDFYNDVDIRKLFGFNNPDAKPTSYKSRRTLAKGLKAGEGKQFAISINHPSHFSGYYSKERLIVH